MAQSRSPQLQAIPVFRGPWWIEPTILYAVAALGSTLIAVLSPEEFFAHHDSPKYVEWKHFGLAVIATAAFGFGAFVGKRAPLSTADTSNVSTDWLAWWFKVTTTLTLTGYVVWFALAFRNGLSPALVLRLLRGVDDYTFTALKESVFVRIPGVTTATQFGMAAVALGIILWKRKQTWVLWGMAGIVFFAAARALLFSERLALIELAIPVAISWLRFSVLGKRVPAMQRIGWQLAPAAAVAGVVLMFGTFEYFRSWQAHQKKYDSIVEFTLMRLSGYYNMAVNSSAMQLEIGVRNSVPYETMQFFWQFPLVKLSPLSHQQITGLDMDEERFLRLHRYANPELNNDGGVFLPVYDYGYLGLPVFWAVIGVGVGYAYRNYLAGRLAGLVLYPLLFICILEVPRIMYFTSQRFLPSLAIAIAMIVFSRYEVLRFARRGSEANQRLGGAVAG